MQIENGRFYFISNEFIKKYGIKELPSLLIFKSGKMIGKIDGYYSIEDKEEFIKEIRAII